MKYLNNESIEQYRAEERTLIAYRVAAARYRLMDLLNIMSKDVISTPDKRDNLKLELEEFYQSKVFHRCKTMGEIVKQMLRYVLQPYLTRIQRNLGKIVD